MNNFTPLSEKKPEDRKIRFNLSNEILLALFFVLIISIGLILYLLVLRKPLRPKVPTVVPVSPTNTPTPPIIITVTPTIPLTTITSTITPTKTLTPTNPPAGGSTPTGTLTPSPTGTLTPTPTPTEIILVKNTSTPGPSATNVPVTQIPSVGVATFGKIFGIISFAVILLGLIL